jgi:glutaredoxin
MATMPRRFVFAGTLVAAIFASAAAAQTTPPIYRYVDPNGRVIYSDHMPPANAKNVEAKRLTQNYIETDRQSLETKQARDRYPVTLYTFDCGETCDKAQALLNRRGVPFRVVDVRDAKGIEQLKKVSGGDQVPVLQAGEKLIAKGYSEAGWTALLDDAGYPKAPAPRRPQQSLAVGKDAAKVAAPTQQPPAAPAAPAASAGGGYPKLQ